MFCLHYHDAFWENEKKKIKIAIHLNSNQQTKYQPQLSFQSQRAASGGKEVPKLQHKKGRQFLIIQASVLTPCIKAYNSKLEL